MYDTSTSGVLVWYGLTEGSNDDSRILALLKVDFGTDVDKEDAERLTRQLRTTLADLDFEASGSPPSTDHVPANAKSGTALTVGEIIVTFSASGGVIVTLIGVLRDWLHRHSAGRRISVTIGRDTVQLERSTPAERERLIDVFIRAHDGGE